MMKLNVAEMISTNEGAYAAQAEIRAFLAFETERMQTSAPTHAKAEKRAERRARAFVFLRTLLAKIDAHIAQLEVAERQAAERERPTVRQTRKGR